MTRERSLLGIRIGVGLLATIAGCSIPKMTVEQMRAMKPDRAPQLDQLNMFVGQWEGQFEMSFTFLDRPITGKGTSNVGWECDHTLLLNRGEFDGEIGKMSGLEAWTWDPDAEKFRLHWVDNWGMTGKGTATYDEGTRTWHIEAAGSDPDGHTTRAEGTIAFRDSNTMEWTWSEWSWGKLAKIGEFKGTNRRKM